ncbi:MAG: hypothetical protein ACKPJJ_00325, partial [Planctomycetaceae bacterium]
MESRTGPDQFRRLPEVVQWRQPAVPEFPSVLERVPALLEPGPSVLERGPALLERQGSIQRVWGFHPGMEGSCLQEEH